MVVVVEGLLELLLDAQLVGVAAFLLAAVDGTRMETSVAPVEAERTERSTDASESREMNTTDSLLPIRRHCALLPLVAGLPLSSHRRIAYRLSYLCRTRASHIECYAHCCVCACVVG